LVEGGYNWVDVRDVVSGAIQAERLAPSGRRYILSGHWHSVSEVAQMTAAITGKPAPRVTVPLWLAYLAEPLMARLASINSRQPLYSRFMLNALRSNRQMSHARATRELDYAARPFKETLRDTLRWFEKQDGLNKSKNGNANV
jgi:dihydroflavonol-4-reductase